jgi:membrane-bound serine protease (ClpP class)
MDYSSIAIWMAVLTLLLIVAEVFVPSGGLITIFAVICAVASVWAAWNAWYHGSPVIWWVYLICFISAIPAVMVGNVLILQRTPWGRRLMPEPRSADQTRPFTKEREKLQQLVGSFGTTATLHTPGGITVVDGKRYHSESKSFMIEPETQVKIVGVDGTRIVVRPVTDAELQALQQPDEGDRTAAGLGSETPQTEVSQTDQTPEPEEKLDFPFPEG